MVLFENISLKINFYKALKQVNPETFSGNLALMLIIECGRATIKNAVLGQSGTLFMNCQTPEELGSILRNIIRNPNGEIGNCKVNTVIIENISAFYWETKLWSRVKAGQWYTEINRLIRLLMAKYGCNVLTTMWDRNYEFGFSLRPIPDMAVVKLDDLTCVPGEFFEGPMYIYASQSTRSLRCKDGQWTPA